MTTKLNICILLTATIDPKDMVFLERSDPVVRENDYINAMQKWLSVDCVSSIVFCENSDYNLDRIRELASECRNKNIEVIQFDGQNSFAKELGKGYGELLILKHAVDSSRLIKDSDYIIKVTGRYFIENIEKIVDGIGVSDGADVMADLEKNLTWADSRIFIFKPSFINTYLLPFQGVLNDTKGIYMEHVLSRAILQAISQGRRWIPLLHSPIIDGYEGTSNAALCQSRFRVVYNTLMHSLKNYLIQR